MMTHRPGDAGERRLHPLSWLFVLLQQLRQFLLPLALLLLFGVGDRNQWWGLLAVAALASMSLWQYFTYRYRIGTDSLLVRSGLLERSLREIPFSRIHHVGVHQTPLHRMFGVAEVRLESASGRQPEAEMRVLRLADAHALEALIRAHARSQETAIQSHSADAASAETILLSLPPGELVRLGLLSRRGLLAVGAGIAASSQINVEVLAAPLEQALRRALAWFDLHPFSATEYAAASVSAALLAALVLQALAVALTALQYGRFQLSRHGQRLTITRGLLSRSRGSLPLHRIQAWNIRAGIGYRWLRRRRLTVATVTAIGESRRPAVHELAPIVRPERCDALLRQLLPAAAWPIRDWRPLHRRASWLFACPGLTLSGLLAGLGWHGFGNTGGLALLCWPWILWLAGRRARHAGWRLQAESIAIRDGGWSHRWQAAELDKLQTLEVSQSPLQRWLGMATLTLDTAGDGPETLLRIRGLALADAVGLQKRLAGRVARRPLRW